MWGFIVEYRLNIIACTVSILFLIFIVESVRKERLKEAYSLIWIGMGCVFIIFSIWKQGVDYLSNLIGIYYSPAMFFLLLILMILLILIQFSVVISKQSERIKTLTQEVALMKHEMENAKKKDK